MSNATWGEFKERVEALGVKDDTEIGWIDVCWSGVGQPEIRRYLEGYVTIDGGL